MSTNNKQLPDSAIWFVRADKRNELSGYFLANGVVAIGWGIGPIDPVESRVEIADCLRRRYPATRQTLLSKWAREIREFNQDIGVGDAVATYEPRGRTYHIGVILSLLADPTEHAPFLSGSVSMFTGLHGYTKWAGMPFPRVTQRGISTAGHPCTDSRQRPAQC